MSDTTIVCLSNMVCAVFRSDERLPCPRDAAFLLIEKDGAYTPVCWAHIATDTNGLILPDIDPHGHTDRADAEREQARAEHLGELAEERAMVQAQTPVVNVGGESG